MIGNYLLSSRLQGKTLLSVPEPICKLPPFLCFYKKNVAYRGITWQNSSLLSFCCFKLLHLPRAIQHWKAKQTLKEAEGTKFRWIVWREMRRNEVQSQICRPSEAQRELESCWLPRSVEVCHNTYTQTHTGNTICGNMT